MKWRSLSEDEIKKMPADRLGRIAHEIQEWIAKAKGAVAQAEILLATVQKYRNTKSGSRED